MKLNQFLLECIISVSCLFSFIILSINLPDSFGRTNFIIGVDAHQLRTDLREPEQNILITLKPNQLGIRHALFSPDDHVLQVLLDLIKNENKSIKMAAFLLTDNRIIQAIIDARERGVSIELIFDPQVIQKRNTKKLKKLLNSDANIFIYNAISTANNYMSNIMHNKFIIFGENIYHRAILWTGSFNFTYSAHKNNQENVVIFDDNELIKKFEEQFDRLKTRCTLFTNLASTRPEIVKNKPSDKNNTEIIKKNKIMRKHELLLMS